MILGVGIDIVKIDRFKRWQDFSYDQMRRVFSRQELEDPTDLSQLASRFAAKEAFFKALSASLVTLGMIENEFSFLFLCRHVEVRKTTWNVPMLHVDWESIGQVVGKGIHGLRVDLSLSHEKEFAVAYVVISKVTTWV